jgi:serine/threonine protein kinase
MVTGKPPFEGQSAAQVMLQHIQEQVISPREIDRSLPDGLCRVVEKMMAKDREDRYQDPTELLDDLRLVAEGKEPRNSDIKPWDATVRRAGGPRLKKSRSRLAPVNFSDVPLAPEQPAARTGRGSRATRARRPTRDRTTQEPPAAARPGRMPPWVLILIIAGVAAFCALGGWLLHRLVSGNDHRRVTLPPPEVAPADPKKPPQ